MISAYAGVLLLTASVAFGSDGANSGLPISSNNRNLQNGGFDLCGTDFNPGGRKTHLLANLDSKGRTLLRWVPFRNFEVNVNPEAGTATLSGGVVPLGEEDEENLLTINFEYSDPVDFEQCFCASAAFAGSLTDPNYKRIETKCDLERFMSRPAEAEDLLFCPTCENDQCRIANKERDENGAPEPIYADWSFFQTVTGSLSGPGLELFRRTIIEGFESFGLDPEITTCTPDITNLPLPQLECSNLDDPSIGFGYGVNGKNQNCGFSSWFNCEEDVEQLGGGMLKTHVADINLNIIPCPPPNVPVCTNVTVTVCEYE